MLPYEASQIQDLWSELFTFLTSDDHAALDSENCYNFLESSGQVWLEFKK